MAPKKGNLSSALNEAAGKPVQATPPEQPAQAPTNKKPHDRPSRANTKLIGGHFDEAVSRQLKHMAIDEGKTMQEMLAEALNLLFEHYGKKPHCLVR